jgi:hypothetical protein
MSKYINIIVRYQLLNKPEPTHKLNRLEIKNDSTIDDSIFDLNRLDLI